MNGQETIRKEEVKVGIVVPVYNVEEYICDCIESVINQKYTNWILILVDDGSPDKCPEICDKYASKDSRIQVIHKENGGLVSAWVAGLNCLPENVEYVTFIDSDDWITDMFLQQLVNKYYEHRADMVVSRLCRVYPDGKTSVNPFYVEAKYYDRESLVKELFPVLLYGGDFHKRGVSTSRCSKLIRRKLITQNIKYISEKTTYEEDLNIMLLAFLDAESVDLVETMECLYMVRSNPNSMTRAYDKNMRSSIFYVYDSLFKAIYEKKCESIFEKQLLADYLAASVQYYKNELLNPNGINEGIHNIAEYIKDNDRLKKAILDIEWRHYRKLNVIIIKAMDNYNWFNRNVITIALHFAKLYKIK